MLEELVQRFEHRIATAALAASATAISVARVLLGEAPDFQVETLNYPTAEVQPLLYVLGGIAGLLAIAYNRTLLATLAAAERLRWLPVELRAGLIGSAIGTLAWFAPGLVGGGDEITARTLAGGEFLSSSYLPFFLDFGSARCHMQPAHRAGYLRLCWFWVRNLGCCLAQYATWCFPGWTCRSRNWAAVNWPFGSCAVRSTAMSTISPTVRRRKK